MNADKLKTVLVALTDLIADELAGDAPDRFARVNRLAVLAQKLQKEGATSVRDFAAIKACGPDDINEFDGDVGHAGIIGMRVQPALNLNNGETVRNIMDAVMPTMQAQGDAAHARQRRERAEELNELIAAREQLGADTDAGRKLSQRIAQLIGDVTEETDHADVSMVPTQLLRRHLAGTEGEEPNSADVPGPVTDGEGRDGGADQASPGVTAAFGLGVSLGIEAAESQVDAAAVAAPVGADQRGAEGASQSTEAGP